MILITLFISLKPLKFFKEVFEDVLVFVLEGWSRSHRSLASREGRGGEAEGLGEAESF